jgi:hypothetical protein
MASQNLQPSRKENAFIRRKSDERVEVLGTPCEIYRAQETYEGKPQYDAFDRPIVSNDNQGMPPARDSFILIEKNEEYWSTVGEKTGQQIDGKYPYIATFKFEDDVRKLDLVDVPYEYAQNAGVQGVWSGEPKPPTETLKTRFKIQDRVMQGVNSTVQNQYYCTPTEETWE